MLKTFLMIMAFNMKHGDMRRTGSGKEMKKSRTDCARKVKFTCECSLCQCHCQAASYVKPLLLCSCLNLNQYSMSSSSLLKASTQPRTLLAAYTTQLAAHPLRTKALTAATLSFIQEVLASYIAHAPPQRPPKSAPRLLHALADARIDARALKMAAYGFLVSAPLGHLLVSILQRAFAGKTGPRARIGQILASNLFFAPIQGSGMFFSFHKFF